MKKNALIALLIFLVLTVIFSGCIDEKEPTNFDRFIGTWKTDQGVQLELFSDDTCIFLGSSGEWNIEEEKINITVMFEGGKNMMSFNYEFSNDYKTVTLTDPGERVMVFTKQ